ncbi:MAG: iron-sulfur cluster assembly accessory protein [Planctomycetes bacterium]|nr:iron-sulfur cluster assembly accessory protein [Planctomycetota bacterium]
MDPTHAHQHGPATAPPPPPTGAPVAAITITPKAASKLRELIAQEKKDPATTGLRLGVQGGGCSGLSYFMDFDTKHDNDRVFTQDEIQVFVDPRSILYMSGSVLDYAEGLMGSGFSIKNPNVKSSCGCGSSFTT